MKLLLDTHAFLWWIIDAPQLSQRAREIIGDAENTLFLSAASGWEIAIKAGLGKLSLPADMTSFILSQMHINAITSLPILLSHALHVHTLPDLHRDPFDRMLIAQAQLESLPVITIDPKFTPYQVEVIW